MDRKQNSFFNVVAKSKDEADVLLYGDVASWSRVNARDFANKLFELEDKYSKINIRINSPGGVIFEGLAIFNLIKSSELIVHTFIDGLAASMASVLAVAGDEVHMADNARMMVHQSAGGVSGSALEIRTYADMMDGLNKTLASIYAAKTGKETQWILDNWFKENEDKWFTAEEAKAEGLVDYVFKGKVKKKAPKTSHFKAIAAFYEEELSSFDETIETQNKDMDKEKLIKALGLKADASDDEILQAVADNKTAADASSAETDNMDALIALAESKGMDTDMVKLAAKADFKAALAKVKAYEKPAPSGGGGESGKGADKTHESLADAILKLAGKSSEKKDKGMKDYTEAELKAMQEQKPEEFEKLLKAEYPDGYYK